jgi:cytochrome o ubiquinol oxidase operon protein cyoD
MKATLKSYITGFILSVLLTLAAAGLIWIHINSGHTIFTHQFLTIAILVLAVAQLFVQLIFFMHLANESGPRWKLAVFASTVGIILIIIVGSIWIMNHLNYNMMASPSDMNAYIQSQDGF